jgi:hypothetical protein
MAFLDRLSTVSGGSRSAMEEFHLIQPAESLFVEGAAENGVGDFRGPVLAIGLQETDPVAASNEGVPLEQEGLVGWGTTCFLVADDRKPAPIWVKKENVLRHRIGQAGLVHTTRNGRSAQNGRSAEARDDIETEPETSGG